MCTLYTLLIKRYLLTLLRHSYTTICNFIAYLIQCGKQTIIIHILQFVHNIIINCKSIAFTGLNANEKVCNDINLKSSELKNF